jgi:hypothetical protein
MKVMDMLNTNTEPWHSNIPVMHQYANYMKIYEGKTLKEAGITLNPNGSKTKANIITQYFHHRHPYAFYFYEIENTPITPYFLHQARLLSDHSVPDSFLSERGVKDIKTLPFNNK